MSGYRHIATWQRPDQIVGPHPISWDTIVAILTAMFVIAPAIVVVCWLAARGVERVRRKLYELYGRR